MTDDPQENPKGAEAGGAQPDRSSGPDRFSGKMGLDPAKSGAGSKSKMPLPGMVAISLYMLVLAMVVTFGVIGGHVARLYLILVPLFLAASFGLLRMFRWAWALTLSAAVLLMTYNFWIFLEQKQPPGAIQGLLNLVFFLYLIRADVRERLR